MIISTSSDSTSLPAAKEIIQESSGLNIIAIKLCQMKELMFGTDKIRNKAILEITWKNQVSSSKELLSGKLTKKTKTLMMVTSTKMKEPWSKWILI